MGNAPVVIAVLAALTENWSRLSIRLARIAKEEAMKKCNDCLKFNENRLYDCYRWRSLRQKVNGDDRACSEIELDRWKERLANTAWVLAGGWER